MAISLTFAKHYLYTRLHKSHEPPLTVSYAVDFLHSTADSRKQEITPYPNLLSQGLDKGCKGSSQFPQEKTREGPLEIKAIPGGQAAQEPLVHCCQAL